jgi:multicomponent Na+:H+ antiporter subunit B
MISLSLILRTATRLLMPLLLVFSLFMLLRGHNEPGGGFIAGLTASAAFALHAIAFGAPSTRRVLYVDTHAIIGWGLLIALVSGVPALLQGRAFMGGAWLHVEIAGRELELGTPLLFDLGVYLVVLGAVVTIILTLAEEE